MAASFDANESEDAAADLMSRAWRAADDAQLGFHEKALAELLWCFDSASAKAPGYRAVRATSLLGKIAELAKVFEPAKAALIERRDRAENVAIHGNVTFDLFHEAAALNRALGTRGRVVDLFVQLASRSNVDTRRRQSLMLIAIGDVCDLGRYDAVRGFADDLVALARPCHEALALWIPPKISQRRELPENLRTYALATIQKTEMGMVASLYEALLGIGELERAKVVLRESGERVGATADIFVALAERAVRVGKTPVARDILDYGMKSLDGAESDRLRSAAAQLGLEDIDTRDS